MRYPTELDKVETKIIIIDAEIERLEKIIESKSLEIKDRFYLSIKELEEEIDELKNVKFRLGSFFCL